MNHRDRQILCGLFLSKFNQKGLAYLGFDGFTEAFNALGYSLQARPASIKNYRDELDPYFPNKRKGWHKRPLREHCQRVLDAYKGADVGQLGELIKGFLMPVREVESMPEVKRVLGFHDAEASSSFAKRLITGMAAEQYFAANYSAMTEFSGLTLTNTTGWGCGFDFKLAQPSGESYCAVEVKGLRARCGQIQLTELEHEMADALGERYYLVLVRNFVEEPFHTVINNPADCAIRYEGRKKGDTILMDRKRRRMTEGLLYLFSLPRSADKATISEALEKALEVTDCGRVLGSGTSLANEGTVVIEIGAFDRDATDDAISHVCRRLKCRDFEVAWD